MPQVKVRPGHPTMSYRRSGQGPFGAEPVEVEEITQEMMDDPWLIIDDQTLGQRQAKNQPGSIKEATITTTSSSAEKAKAGGDTQGKGENETSSSGGTQHADATGTSEQEKRSEAKAQAEAEVDKQQQQKPNMQQTPPSGTSKG